MKTHLARGNRLQRAGASKLLKDSSLLMTTWLICATPALVQAEPVADSALPSIDVRATTTPASKSKLAGGIAAAPIDTPYSVSTVSVETLQDQGGISLQDLLRNVPGATADLSFTGSHAQVFVLRGFLADSGTGSSRVLRDGARLSNYPFVPAFVDSVDVLRGPGAAVGTRSEPGGTVQIITKQPQLSNFGSVSVGIGAYGARETAVDINRVLSADNELAARLVVNHSESSEWRGVPDRLDGVKLGLAKSDGDRYHIRLGVEAIDQRYRPDFGVPALNGRPVAVPVDRQFAEPWSDSTTRNQVYDLHADVALSEQTRWALDWTHLEAGSTSVRQSLSALVNSSGSFSRVIAVEPDTRRRIDSLASSLSSELRAGAVTHKLYAGVEYYRERLAQPSGVVVAPYSPNINVYNPVYGLVTQPGTINTTLTTENLESTSLSLQDSLDWQDWTLVAGLQYMKQRFFYGSVGSSIDENKLSPKLALLRHLTPTQTMYASYSTGTSPNQAASATGQSLASRTARQVELGWKSAWFDNQLNTDLALFWLTQNNMLADDPSTLSIYDKKLSGQGRSKGVEFTLAGQLSRQWSVVSAYAYTNSHFAGASEFAGKTIPNVAAHTLSLFAHYDWDDQWRSGVGLYAQGRRYADEANTTIMPGYGRIDATQTYRIKLATDRSFELQLSLRNLLNKEYYAASHLHVTRYILPGESRSLMLTGTYRF